MSIRLWFAGIDGGGDRYFTETLDGPVVLGEGQPEEDAEMVLASDYKKMESRAIALERALDHVIAAASAPVTPRDIDGVVVFLEGMQKAFSEIPAIMAGSK